MEVSLQAIPFLEVAPSAEKLQKVHHDAPYGLKPSPLAHPGIWNTDQDWLRLPLQGANRAITGRWSLSAYDCHWAGSVRKGRSKSTRQVLICLAIGPAAKM